MSGRRKRAVKLTALVAAVVVPWLVLTGSDPKAVAAPDLRVSFNPASDTYVTSRSSGSSFGGSSVIEVSRSAFRGLVRFDTGSLPAGSTVISAVLKVYSLESKSGAVNVHPMWNEWTEASSRDDLSSWDASVLGSSDEVTANTWETIRLPASALDAPSWWLNFSKAGTVVDLASREDPAHAPQLIVTYAASDSSVPSPTTAPDPSPSGGDIVLGGVGDTNPDGNKSTTSASGLTAASIKAANVDAWVHLGDHQYQYGDCGSLVNEFDRAGWGEVWNKALNTSGPTHDWSSGTDTQ